MMQRMLDVVGQLLDDDGVRIARVRSEQDNCMEDGGELAYVDDLTIMVEAQSAEELESKVSAVLASLNATFQQYGMSMNCEAGKTEVIFAPKGAGTAEVRGRLERGAKGSRWFVFGHGAKCRVTKQYKHLGIVLDERLQMGPEIARRCRQSNVALHQLRPALRCRSIRMNTRRKVIMAAVIPRLFHGAETWPDLLPRWRSRLEAAYLHAIRVVTGEKPRDGTWLSLEQCLVIYDLPGIDEIVSKRRLKFMADMVNAPDYISGFFREHMDGAWWEAAWSDADRMWQETSKLDELERPLGEVAKARWLDFISTWPRQWKAIVKAWTLVKGCARDYDVQVPCEPVPSFSCEICNKIFVKRKGLTMHVSLVHGKAGFLSSRVPIREDCPFCGVWTGTRLKLVQHLRVGALACRLQAASLPLLCAAEYEAALEADRQIRRKSRLLGVGELAYAAGS